LFGRGQIPDVLEVLGWYDDVQANDVHRAVLVLSKGDVNALLDLVAAAVDDFRDVLMWASLPEPTPEEREAARARAAELIRQYREARHRHLVGTFGVKGAEQIERSNDKLFGNPTRGKISDDLD
jgi:cell division septum initiation protein DivIVA